MSHLAWWTNNRTVSALCNFAGCVINQEQAAASAISHQNILQSVALLGIQEHESKVQISPQNTSTPHRIILITRSTGCKSASMHPLNMSYLLSCYLDHPCDCICMDSSHSYLLAQWFYTNTLMETGWSHCLQQLSTLQQPCWFGDEPAAWSQ